MHGTHGSIVAARCDSYQITVQSAHSEYQVAPLELSVTNQLICHPESLGRQWYSTYFFGDISDSPSH